MSHRWADLGTAAERTARDAFVREAARAWRELLGRADRPPSFRFARGVWAERRGPRWVVRWAEAELRPLADAVARTAPPAQEVLLGLPALGWEAARALALRLHGVDLEGAEVRVGITRGHLLALAFSIPLDTRGGPDELQAATECLCENALGEQTLDRWIATIDVVRAPRRSRLSVLPAGPARVAETHPLHLLESLVERGVTAVTEQLPESQLMVECDDWTGLELQADPEGIQGDRLQAFTRCPEALKAALEGLPFDSARFTRGREVMIWFAWTQPSLSARLAARETAEAVVAEVGGTEPACAVCGSGFGPVRDYLDVWAIPEVEVLGKIRDELARRLGTPVELGFYDTEWARERFRPDFGSE